MKGLMRCRQDGECAGSRSVRRPRNGCTDTVKECLRKRGLDARQGRRIVHDRCEWVRFVRGNSWGRAWGMNS